MSQVQKKKKSNQYFAAVHNSKVIKRQNKLAEKNFSEEELAEALLDREKQKSLIDNTIEFEKKVNQFAAMLAEIHEGQDWLDQRSPDKSESFKSSAWYKDYLQKIEAAIEFCKTHLLDANTSSNVSLEVESIYDSLQVLCNKTRKSMGLEDVNKSTFWARILSWIGFKKQI